MSALYILAHHAYILQFGEGATGQLTDALLYGHLGVTTFIVLSGLCLGLPLRQNKPIFYRQWFKHRCQRIMPPYYGAIAVIGLITATKASLLGFFIPITINGMLANLLLLGDVYPNLAKQFSITFWSVCVEFKIYMFFPLLVAAWRRWNILGLLVCSTFCASVAAISQNLLQIPLDYACPWYVIIFAVGIAISQSNSKCWHLVSLLGFTCLASLLYCFPYTQTGALELFKPHLLPIDLAFGLSVGALMGWLISKNSNRWLDFKLFKWLAAWSYSLYLIHYPLLKQVNFLLSLVEVRGWQAIAFETIPVLACCYLFSLVFERRYAIKEPCH
ncbi:MAG: acyltransferase [Stenomitos rutilans HA7619-LM2]|nr:acyltransferase [Stenomitos rutilans HA7619-LM2]MBW4469426.1 acyltransferase [Stenomitos rutilans HA7619-LM2]